MNATLVISLQLKKLLLTPQYQQLLLQPQLLLQLPRQLPRLQQLQQLQQHPVLEQFMMLTKLVIVVEKKRSPKVVTLYNHVALIVRESTLVILMQFM